MASTREHNDPQGGAALPQLLADGESVDAGHHNVQQHNIEVSMLCVKGFQGFFAAVYVGYIVAGTLEVDDHEITDHILVLAYKNSFQVPVPSFLHCDQA